MIQFFRRSAPTDQADRLRQLVEDSNQAAEQRADENPAGPPMVVVAGSKGGVGTTTLAYYLAKAFAGLGHRTVAVDANLRQADLGQVARAPAGADANISDVMAGEAAAADALVHLDPRLWLMPGAWAPATHPLSTPEGAERLASGLASLANRADVLVVDAGAGHTPTTAPLWSRASVVLLAATPEPLSILGAYAAVKLARAADERPELRLLVNRTRTHDEGPAAHAAIGQTCQRFLGAGLPLAGSVAEGDLVDGLVRIAHRLKLTRPTPDASTTAPESATQLAAA